MENLEENNQLWIPVLEKYKILSCLWDRSNKFYKDKKIQNRAWQELIQLSQKVVYRNADLNFLQTNLCNFINKYRFEAKKVEAANLNCVSYNPEHFCYNILKSIYEVDNQKPNRQMENIPIKQEVKISNKIEELIMECSMPDEQLVSEEIAKNLVFGNAENKGHISNEFLDRDLSSNYKNDELFFANIETNKLSKENKIWLRVIAKYASYKCLWNYQCNYKSYDQDKSWQKLLKIWRTVDPGTTILELKKRIQDCRVAYTKIFSEAVKAKEQGHDLNIDLFYFNAMSPVFQKDWTIAMPTSDVSTDDSSSDFEEEPIDEQLDSGHNDLISDVDGVKKHLDEKVASTIKNYATKGLIYANIDSKELSEEEKIWLQVIKRYVSFKCLWDHGNKINYKDSERDKAWHKLLRIWRATCSKATIANVKERMSNSRATFRRHFKLALKAKEQEQIFTTRLYYFNEMSPIYQKGWPKIENFSDNSTDNACSDQEVDSEIDQKVMQTIKDYECKGLIYANIVNKKLTQEQKVWRKVIQKYVAYKCLWDHENRDNYKEYERDEAWSDLLETWRAAISSASLLQLKERIGASRAVYRRYIKIARQAKEQGKIFTTKIYYFNDLSPLYQKGWPVTEREHIVEESSNEESNTDDSIETFHKKVDDFEKQNKVDIEEFQRKGLIYATNANMEKLTDQEKVWLKVIEQYVSFKLQGKINNQAWQALLEIARAEFPKIDIADLKNKIQCFSAGYRGSLRRALQAQKEGKPFEIKAFYFNALIPLFQKKDLNEYSCDGDDPLLCKNDFPNMNTEKENKKKECDMNKTLAERLTSKLIDMDELRKKEEYEKDLKELKSKELIYASTKFDDLDNSQKHWLRILKQYTSYRLLWVQSTTSRDLKKSRDQDFFKLLKLAKTNFPQINMKELKTKIRSFCARCERELQRAIKGKALGKKYKIKGYFFNTLTPLYEKMQLNMLNRSEINLETEMIDGNSSAQILLDLEDDLLPKNLENLEENERSTDNLERFLKSDQLLTQEQTELKRKIGTDVTTPFKKKPS